MCFADGCRLYIRCLNMQYFPKPHCCCWEVAPILIFVCWEASASLGMALCLISLSVCLSPFPFFTPSVCVRVCVSMCVYLLWCVMWCVFSYTWVCVCVCVCGCVLLSAPFHCSQPNYSFIWTVFARAMIYTCLCRLDCLELLLLLLYSTPVQPKLPDVFLTVWTCLFSSPWGSPWYNRHSSLGVMNQVPSILHPEVHPDITVMVH